MGKTDTAVSLLVLGAGALGIYWLAKNVLGLGDAVSEWAKGVSEFFNQIGQNVSKVPEAISRAVEEAKQEYEESPYTPVIYKSGDETAMKQAAAQAITTAITQSPQAAQAYNVISVASPETSIYQQISAAAALSKTIEEITGIGPVH